MLRSGVLAVNPELLRIYDGTPEDEPRSRLQPYCELILRWRRQGKSYRKICKLLADKCDVRIGRTALNEFVQRPRDLARFEPKLSYSQRPPKQSCRERPRSTTSFLRTNSPANAP
jgi:hypothetical protein